MAAAMSQAGYDVAMQYGTTQPDWDILATKGERTLKLQVKGSQDGGWGLFQSYIKNTDYHGALKAWLDAQITDIIYVLVQFADVPVGAAPRCYVARPTEILEHMKSTRGGHAYTSLRENYTYTKGLGAGYTDIVPRSWRLSQERIDAV